MQDASHVAHLTSQIQTLRQEHEALMEKLIKLTAMAKATRKNSAEIVAEARRTRQEAIELRMWLKGFQLD